MAKQIPISNRPGMFAIVDDEDYEEVSQYIWTYMDPAGYVLKSRGVTTLLHRFVMNPPKGMCVDHINHNKLDNRRDNLRICTRQQNSMNQPWPKPNSRKYRCIKQNMNGTWSVLIYSAGSSSTTIVCDTKEEAMEVFKNRIVQIRGEYANTRCFENNSPIWG